MLYILSFFALFDILKSLMTGYYNKYGILETSKKRLASKYWKYGMKYDILALIAIFINRATFPK